MVVPTRLAATMRFSEDDGGEEGEGAGAAGFDDAEEGVGLLSAAGFSGVMA